MIKFNARFSFYRDSLDWRLIETYDGKDMDGNPKPQRRQTYHRNLDSIARTIIDRCAGDCTDMDDLRQLLHKAGSTVAEHLEWLKERSG